MQVLASATSPEQALNAEIYFPRQNATSTGVDEFESGRVPGCDRIVESCRTGLTAQKVVQKIFLRKVVYTEDSGHRLAHQQRGPRGVAPNGGLQCQIHMQSH